MAIPIKAGVASPAGVGASAKPNTLADMFANQMGFGPKIPDPRSDVMATVGAIPQMEPDQSAPRGIPLMDTDGAVIRSE